MVRSDNPSRQAHTHHIAVAFGGAAMNHYGAEPVLGVVTSQP